MREVVIILIILVIIICGTIYEYKYLDKTADILVSELENLKHSIEQGDTSLEQSISQSEKIYAKWNDINKKWSNIVLHEEIDSIETSVIKVKSKIKIGNLDESIEDIDTSIFLVNHIREKEKTSLKNIF